MKSEVNLEISEYGRPIIYIADYYYKCLPGTACEHITTQVIFASRHEAVRWAKFEMRDEIDWSAWESGTEDYPNLKNYDAGHDITKGLNPTFIATIERTFPEGTILKRVTVHKTEVCGEFNWWAKEANGNWNSEPTKEGK